jgi:FkbM family methyltransferase
MQRLARLPGVRRLARLLAPSAARRIGRLLPGAAASGAGRKRLASARQRAEHAKRTKFLAEARELTPYVSVVVGGGVFFVPTSDLRIGARLFVRARSKDMDVLAQALGHLAALGHRMPSDPGFVDVGANLGTTTITALRHHGFSSAIAFEPSPETFRALRVNLVANDLESRVHAMQVAVSDQEGQCAFDVSDPNSGAHRLLGEGVRSGDQMVMVSTVTLDGLVARGTIDLDCVGLLRIDAAGHESRVLAAASRLLEAGVPIVTAVKRRWAETAAALAELLTPQYTDVVQLRELDARRPASELRDLVDRVEHSTDVLLVRR